jgi:hypothetical protein
VPFPFVPHLAPTGDTDTAYGHTVATYGRQVTIGICQIHACSYAAGIASLRMR